MCWRCKRLERIATIDRKSASNLVVSQALLQLPFFCNLPQYIRDPYKRFLENQLREHYNFEGVPIRLFFRKK